MLSEAIQSLNQNQNNIQKQKQNQNQSKNQQILLKLLQQKQLLITQLKQIASNPNIQPFPMSQKSTYKMHSLKTTQHNCYISSINLPHNYNKIYEILKIPENMAKIYPKQMKYKLQLWGKQKQMQVRVQRHRFQFVWPLMDRQFIVGVMCNLAQNSGVFVWKSCQYHSSQILDQKIVQGQYVIGGIILQHVSQLQTKVTYIIQAKLGFAADMIVKNFLHQHAKSITKIEKLLEIQAQASAVQMKQ